MALTKRLPAFPDQIRSGVQHNATAITYGMALVYANPTTSSERVARATADNQASFAGIAYTDGAGIETDVTYIAGGDVAVRCSGAVTSGDPITTAANGCIKTAVATNKEIIGHATMSGADGDIISAHINQTRGLAVS